MRRCSSCSPVCPDTRLPLSLFLLHLALFSSRSSFIPLSYQFSTRPTRRAPHPALFSSPSPPHPCSSPSSLFSCPFLVPFLSFHFPPFFPLGSGLADLPTWAFCRPEHGVCRLRQWILSLSLSLLHAIVMPSRMLTSYSPSHMPGLHVLMTPPMMLRPTPSHQPRATRRPHARSDLPLLSPLPRFLFLSNLADALSYHCHRTHRL